MSPLKLLTVGQASRISGVSVRTLHYYDQIGLLPPPTRSKSGRRLYDSDSLLRLQQILLHRELGFSLSEIRAVLDDPAFDRRAALVAQRQAVLDRIAENEKLVRGIDGALAMIDAGELQAKDRNMKALFEGFDPALYEAEAATLWGQTDLWAEAGRRTASYNKDDWSRFENENNEVCEAFVALLVSGKPPEAREVQQQVEAYRQMTSKWFYPCDDVQIGRLADLYASDSRFRKSFEKHAEGLSDYVIAAFRAFTRAEP